MRLYLEDWDAKKHGRPSKKGGDEGIDGLLIHVGVGVGVLASSLQVFSGDVGGDVGGSHGSSGGSRGSGGGRRRRE